jgi:hypothetical protein
LAPAKFAPKCGPVGTTHPSGLVIDIFGIAAGDWGRCCEDHMVCCGELLEEDFVVRLCMERVLVPNFLAGKGEKWEETTITVNWVTDGVDRCRVGFLPRAYALEGAIYNGVLCQVTEVFTKGDPSRAICEKWYKNKGFARATVISVLNERIPPTGSVDTAAVAGMKGDYLE